MKRLVALLLLFQSALLAQIEIGADMGYVFYDNKGDFEHSNHKDEYLRVLFHVGYQFNSLSDQVMAAFISDREIDELQLSYLFVLASLRSYTPFNALPFIKGTVGIGSAYSDNFTATEASYGGGIGLYSQITDWLRLRFEAHYMNRTWQVSRRGNDPNARVDKRNGDDVEYGVGFGIGIVF
ncbi:MAG: hypothetical protein LBN32_00040 [Helicobacteraceae bacterium]|nr:hypothetical protein [Helicobacteraceae bacterium]